jgi:sulfoquinovosidase
MLRLSLVVTSIVLNVAGCAPSSVTIGDGARATLALEPLDLTIDDANGKRVLHMLGAFAAHDAFGEVTQLLPGWDGYVEGVQEHIPFTRGVLVSSGPENAVVTLMRGDVEAGTLTIIADGNRVRLSFDVVPVREGSATKSSLVFEMSPSEDFFGLGERFASLNHRGRSLYSWAEEGGLGAGEGVPRGPFPNGPSMTYFPVPFFHSSAGYSMHLDTTLRTELHLGSEANDRWRAAVNGTKFDIVVYAAPPLPALNLYTEDTGRPIVPAPWVFGPRRRVSPHQSVDGIEEYRMLRERGVPTTGLDDSVHMLPHNSHAGIEDMLRDWTDEVHANGFKVMAYNNPYVSSSLSAASAEFEFGRDNGFFLLDGQGAIAETFFISGEPQTLATIDLTNPDAFAWFQELLQRSLDLGYDGWMHDFGEYVERDWTAHNGMNGEELHNLFPVLSAMAAHELMTRERPDDYLYFVRSGYSGTQAFTPAVWGGDAEASFDETQGIPSALRSGLSLSMAGVPYWGSDTTGFKCLSSTPEQRDREMVLRWAELSALSPIMMEQNACSNPIEDTDKHYLWDDDEAVRVYGEMARLHTRLQPYFLLLAEEAHETGTPLMRHPFLLHPDNVGARAVDSAFYLGPSLYAAPVIRRGDRTKTTWIPPGRWVDFHDGSLHLGGDIGREVTLAAPLDRVPLLLREGEILPLHDGSIETLAEPTNPDADVVSPAKLADRMDAVVAIASGNSAAIVLVDGEELSVEPANAPNDDVVLTRVDHGDVTRTTFVGPDGGGDVVVDGLRFSSSSKRVTWTLLRLPAVR